MKNNLLLVFATLIAGFVYGQTHDVVITGSKKINKKATPQQIIDSLKTKDISKKGRTWPVRKNKNTGDHSITWKAR